MLMVCVCVVDIAHHAKKNIFVIVVSRLLLK